MNKFKKKHFIAVISLILVFIFILVAGITYSFLTTTVTADEFIIYTGTLAVDYAKKTDVIDVENIYPMTDEQGLTLTPHNFSVTNSGTVDARYQIRFELSEDSTVPIEYIKFAYKQNNGDYSEPILLSDLNSSLVFIKDIIISPKESDSYGIKLWIDISAPNDIQGKTFKARIVVDSIQNVEEEYVVDTIPIITLNKYNDGNTDINLKLNEEYTELGVKEVRDDKDVFEISDVVTSYEYYDGETVTSVNNVDTTQTGIYYVTYRVTDKSNNIGQSIRIVTVNNNDTIPTITLNNDSSISLGVQDDYIEYGATVQDNNKVTIIGEVKTNKVGTYTVKYIVVDKNGNLNSVTRTVYVKSPYQESLLNGSDPVLTSNLVPVQISDDGTVTKASTLSEWYDYETKQWANAVVLEEDAATYEVGDTIEEDDIESYFVWIPKYSYKLWDLGNYSSLTTRTSAEQTINIKFGLNNTSDANVGECTTPGVSGESGNCSVGDYMTHPAFLAFDTNGIWVGKFETGYDGATSTSTAQVSSTDSTKIIIKPNVYSWRSNTMGNMFKVSFDYLTNENSHMMKNTEWGSVAYLSHSIYGTCEGSSCTEVRINNNAALITGYAAVEAPTLGTTDSSMDGNRRESTTPGVDGTYTLNYLNSLSQVASTTGNYSGIYDMSGATYYYVMGYAMIASTVGGSSDITSAYENFFEDENYTKYWDKYTRGGSISGYKYRILGDATGEMGPFDSEVDYDEATNEKSSWYADRANFPGSTVPWFHRGRYYNTGTGSGIFAFSATGGAAASYMAYRIVLAPTK